MVNRFRLTSGVESPTLTLGQSYIFSNLSYTAPSIPPITVYVFNYLSSPLSIYSYLKYAGIMMDCLLNLVSLYLQL